MPKSLQPFFWEFDLNTIDLSQHSSFIIERLLEKGRFEEVRWIFKTFSPEVIRNTIESSLNISQKTRTFWKTYFSYTTSKA